MKKLSLILVISAFGASAFSQFGPSNLIVTVVGDGNADVLNNVPASLQEFTTAGTPVGAPISLAGLSGRNVTMTYGETSEGGLRLSGDKKFLMLGGYDLPARDASFINTVSPRVIVRVNKNKQVTLSPQYVPAAGDGFREVWSDNGSNFFVTGGDMGLFSGPFAGPATQVLPSLVSSRNITRFDGLIYFNGSNAFGGANGMATFNDTTLVQTELFATPGGASGRDFHIVDANTIYYSASTASAGLIKMINVAGVWTEAYRLSGTGIAHIAVVGNTIYAAASAGTTLRRTTDTGTGFAAWTTLATAAANTRFRGVELTPIASASTISGNMVLQNTDDDGAAGTESIDWTLSNGTNTYNGTVSVNDFGGGAYSFDIPAGAPNGAYTLRFKGGTFLASAYNVTLTGGSLTQAVSLRNGNVDQDSEVGPSDFEAVVAQFGGPGAADCDNNGEVGPSDFEIVNANFSLEDQ